MGEHSALHLSPWFRGGWKLALSMSPQHWNSTEIMGPALNYLVSAFPIIYGAQMFCHMTGELKGSSNVAFKGYFLPPIRDVVAAICQHWQGSPCSEDGGIPFLRSVPVGQWPCQLGIQVWQLDLCLAVWLAGKAKALAWARLPLTTSQPRVWHHS